MVLEDTSKIVNDIGTLKSFWSERNKKFREWYEILVLVDKLYTADMETYVSNEPQTFYNMAHYLLTKGEISHIAPIESESALELDKRAKLNRGCDYIWKVVDRERQLAGNSPFIDELAFFLLVLGWYSTVSLFDNNTGLLKTQIWNPYDVFPRYTSNRLATCVHSYPMSISEAAEKANSYGWSYTPKGSMTGNVSLDDYFVQDDEGLHNIILIDSKDVTGWVDRPEMKLLIAPVGGFPDKGSLSGNRRNWRKLTGRGIFEVNEAVANSFNKWKSMVSQILRDTAQPIMQEFTANAKATPEQLRERGALFQYAPGEGGLQRVSPPALPIEIPANLLELRREMQKGSFNDAVYGMVEGQPGYALSLLASSSANQILYPYMDGKHFVVAETDRFWLSNLKSSRRVFQVKGQFIEKLQPTDIPEDVNVEVNSQVATPKDWLERGTIGNMVDKHLDEATIVTQIYGLNDPQAIKRRRSLDRVLNHPMSQQLELIAGYYSHAGYLEKRGDRRQAALFRRAAQALEAQLGAPQPGQGSPTEMTAIEAAREEGAPEERTRVASRVSPPEERGFTPEQLRQRFGRGNLRAV